MPVIENQKLDPTGTTRLRAGFRAEADRRIAKLKANVNDLLVNQDVFSLKGPNIYSTIAGVEPADKVRLFQNSFDVMQADAFSGPWMQPYVQHAYSKGFRHGYGHVHLNQIKAPRIPLLHTAALNELGGIAAAGMQQMVRALIMGLQMGYKPTALARVAREVVNKVHANRMHTFVNTIVVAAHAHGTLDAFQHRGVKRVGIIPEHKPVMMLRDARRRVGGSEPPMAVWVTAGDAHVCPQCRAYEGEVMTIEQARGLIPLHANCRCAWEAIEETELGDYNPLHKGPGPGGGQFATKGEGLTSTEASTPEQFKSWVNTWHSKLSEPESELLQYYQGSGYNYINEGLRSGQPPLVPPGAPENAVEGLDKLLAKNTLPAPVVVYRGIASWQAVAGGWQPEEIETIHDAAFLSTTIKPEVARSFSRREGAIIEYHLPQGFHALAPVLATPEDKRHLADELELVLPRDVTWEVFGTEERSGIQTLKVRPQ